MKLIFKRRSRDLARLSRTVNCSKSNTIQRKEERFWLAMITSHPQMTMLVFKKPSTPEVKSRLPAQSSRKYRDGERAGNQWMLRPTPTSTSLVILLSTTTWSRVESSPRMKFLSEWTCDNTKIRPSSMPMSRGTPLPIKLSRLGTNTKRLICS